MGVKVEISRFAEAEIRAHVSRSGAFEACGLLFGSDAAIDAAEPTGNVSETPGDSFEIDPQALFSAIRAERSGGPQLVGHYHSHPAGSAEPSARDAEMALDMGRLWLIVAGGEIALWRVAAPGRFEAVELCLASSAANRQ